MDRFPVSGAQRIDVDGMLRQASTRMSIDQLFTKGQKYVSVLSREKIDELVNRSVRTIIDKHRFMVSPYDVAAAQRIEAESRAEFEELLHQYQQTADATSAVEHSKQTLEQELQETRCVPDPEDAAPQDRPSENVRTGPLGAFEDFVLELDKQVAQVFKTRKLILERTESPQAVAELNRVEEVLRDIFTNLFHVDRERVAAPVADAREITTLKKRIEKLTAHIVTMEAALKTLSTAKAFSNQQIQNVLRDLGLAQEDKNFEKKKEMLSVVLNENQSIHKKVRELAARGITLETPEKKTVLTDFRDCVSSALARSPV